MAPRTLLALVLLAICVHADDVLVPQGSVWKYKDNGSNQGTAWRQPSFNDAGWDAGPAKLGYGDNDVVTEVEEGPFSWLHYITTYFRHTFTVNDPSAYEGLRVRLQRDDGAVIYLNGVEVDRSNMPSGTIDYLTLAGSTVSGSDEDDFQNLGAPASLLVPGANVLAVEVHQVGPTSSDLGFDLELIGTQTVNLTRGPYLQKATPTSMVVRWRTDLITESTVVYGPSPDQLTQTAVDPGFETLHKVPIGGLTPDTTYYYGLSVGGELLAGGDAEHVFRTAPSPGTDGPLRVWVIGDSGTADADARSVFESYRAYTAGIHTDVWLMLGDNAYGEGTTSQYQAAVFDMYPELLRQTVVWPTRGNHEVFGSDFYDLFTFPKNGESGGFPSGTEDYFSFDHGNVHFVCLNSFETVDASVGGAMYTWLEADLASTDQEWIVAYWHHPPYTKGSHDSDTDLKLIQMRQNFVPLLEDYGVDLTLTGHSHSYERSYFIDGHYGFSFLFLEWMKVDGGDGDPAGDGAYRKEAGPHNGAVHAVCGCSAKTSGGSFDHPAHYVFKEDVLGSMVLDFNGNRMDAKFLSSLGVIEDQFTIEHEGDAFCQTDLGYAGPGDLALSLCGDDLTQVGSTATLSVTRAVPQAPVFLVVSTTFNPTPFGGGTLVPLPITLLVDSLSADATGELHVLVSGGAGPSVSLFLQAVVDDGGAFELSNALSIEIGT